MLFLAVKLSGVALLHRLQLVRNIVCASLIQVPLCLLGGAVSQFDLHAHLHGALSWLSHIAFSNFEPCACTAHSVVIYGQAAAS